MPPPRSAAGPARGTNAPRFARTARSCWKPAKNNARCHYAHVRRVEGMMPVAMIGRAAELAELLDAWSRVGRTGVRTVVITGGAGVGKSRLVTGALAAASPRPALVLAGRARVHSPAPYDWLAGALTGRDLDDLPVPPDALAWLVQHPDAPRERYAPGALLRLAVRAVRAVVGAGPAAIVVEDLHALDPASLNLVGELALVPELPAL